MHTCFHDIVHHVHYPFSLHPYMYSVVGIKIRSSGYFLANLTRVIRDGAYCIAGYALSRVIHCIQSQQYLETLNVIWNG